MKKDAQVRLSIHPKFNKKHLRNIQNIMTNEATNDAKSKERKRDSNTKFNVLTQRVMFPSLFGITICKHRSKSSCVTVNVATSAAARGRFGQRPKKTQWRDCAQRIWISNVLV